MFNNKKYVKFLSFLLVFSLIFSLSGCKDKNANSEKVDTEIFQTLFETNYALIDSAVDSEVLANYIESWARGNDDFKISHDKYGNVIISKKASEGYENAKSTILQCSFELAAPERTAYAMTSIMYIMQYSENHGFMRALFTEPENGIKTVKETYLNADAFISLDWSKNNNIMIGSAGRNDYNVHKDITYQEASYPNAYKITLMGLSPTMACKTNQVNAVKTLGKLLAELKSTGTLLEIAEFNSGFMNNEGEFVATATETDGYPLGVSTIVMVNDNDVSKLTKKIEKSQAKILESYGEDNPELVYEMVQLDASEIKEVISSDDTSTLISFIYTCPNGIYEKNDDGEIISVTNILSCTTLNNSMDMKICALCQYDSNLSSLDTLYQTLCGLYELEETKSEIAPILNIENYESSPAISRISEISFDVYEGKETSYSFGFDNTTAAWLLQRVPNADVVTYGLSEKNIERQVETILTYLERTNQY